MSATKKSSIGFVDGGGTRNEKGVFYYKYTFPEEVSVEVDAMLHQFLKDSPESMKIFDFENFYSTFHSISQAFYQVDAVRESDFPVILKFGGTVKTRGSKKIPFLQVMRLSPIIGFSLTHLADDPNFDLSALDSPRDLYDSYVQIIDMLSKNKTEGN